MRKRVNSSFSLLVLARADDHPLRWSCGGWRRISPPALREKDVTKGGHMCLQRLNALLLSAASRTGRVAMDRLEFDAWMESHCWNGGRSASEHARGAAPKGNPGKRRCTQRERTKQPRTSSQAVTRSSLAKNPGLNSDDEPSLTTVPASFQCHRARFETAPRGDV